MEWISVDDRLPEKDCDVLYVDLDGDMYLGHLESGMDKDIFWTHYDYLEDHHITHWMPLPKPPEG